MKPRDAEPSNLAPLTLSALEPTYDLKSLRTNVQGMNAGGEQLF